MNYKQHYNYENKAKNILTKTIIIIMKAIIIAIICIIIAIAITQLLSLYFALFLFCSICIFCFL